MSKILNTLTAIAILSLPILVYKSCSNKPDQYLELNNKEYSVIREDDGIVVREIENFVGETSKYYDQGFDGTLDRYSIINFYPGPLRINQIIEANSDQEAYKIATMGRFSPIERILEEGDEFENQAYFYHTQIFPLLNQR